MKDNIILLNNTILFNNIKCQETSPLQKKKISKQHDMDLIKTLKKLSQQQSSFSGITTLK